MWVDDPHFNLRYHVRSTALPAPGSEEQLKDLAGRVFAQQLDRDKPLWEIWLVEGLEGDRFALLSKTHHALVDGISGVDIIVGAVRHRAPSPPTPHRPRRALAPAPGADRARSCSARRCSSARRSRPRSRARSRAVFRGPRRVLEASARRRRAASARWPGPGSTPRPPRPSTSHRPAPPLHLGAREPRRHQGDQERARRHGQRRRAGHRRRRARPHLRRRGQHDRRPRAEGDGAGQRARATTSAARSATGRGDDGAAAGLVPGPGRAPRHRARGAEGPQGPAARRSAPRCSPSCPASRPPTMHGPGLAPAVAPALLQPRRDERARPAVPALPARAARMLDLFPMVPLAKNQALGIAIMSYDGRINFGLVGDYDVMPDLDDFADDVQESLAELAAEAGVALTVRGQSRPGGACVRDRLAECARDLGIDVQVQRLEASTRTVADAATAVGCQEAEIAKSIVFVADGDPVVCVASGQPPDRCREGRRRTRRRRGPPGRRRTRCAPPRATRSAACRPSGTTCRSCSTRRSSTTSASGPRPATRNSLFCVDPHKLANCVRARIVDLGE